MKARGVLTGLLVPVSLATLWSVWAQRNQLASLRSRQQQWTAQLAALAGRTASLSVSDSPKPTTPAASSELLRLRSQVTRLTERRRELEGVRAENERLRAQLGSRGTNTVAGSQPPPGYIRKSEAQNVGFNTPEATLQTLLWATRNRDETVVLQAFMPDRADEMRELFATAKARNKDFFSEQVMPPGLRVVGRKQRPDDDSLYLEVELLPGIPHETIQFQQTNGQWKIVGPL